ncbi:DEAD/DEAH box helicase [Hydrocarboniclastica marina]|uniref:ATP-dependent helicase n=1 Tax=Hydrocarboniclastica marina TaxID=2259620 RepID=A0A4P7XLP2_9ALTE|nr:DEAD/DEAH box helicase family protein [Hydrocarboniclastica marina]QCF27484.1 ATP-dependent helicase [Hydrocarboniclastica marina]
MISEIIKGYSFGELAAMIGSDVVIEYEQLIGRNIEKDDLVKAVQAQFGFDLISQDEERIKLIERMSEDNVRDLVKQLIPDHEYEPWQDTRINIFNVLIRLANRWPNRFISLLGFEDQTLDQEEGSSVRGIINITPLYPTYPYQKEIVRKANCLINSKKHFRCLIHLPTGAGKTRTAMNIAADHLRANVDGLVLWLADTSELCEQAANEFTKAWTKLGDRQLKLYSYYSDTNISLGGVEEGFLVAGLQKLNAASGSKDYKILYDQLRKHVTLIVFDEAHKAIAPTYSKIVNDMVGVENEAFFIGLSATPGRKLDFNSDEDERLTEFFHGNKVTMKMPGYESPITYLVRHQYLAKASFVNIEYSGNKIRLANDLADQKRSREIRDALSEDGNRNLRLIEVLSDEYKKGSSVIVFACNIDHSRKLAAMLAFSGIKAYSLDSRNDTSETRRRKIKEYLTGRVKVLVNFNILTAGFDAPNTNVVVIARPTDSLVQYSQMAGRAMRGVKSGGNENCTVYTVRDDIPAFRSVVQAFMHWDNLWSEV